jgi:Histidine phosphatase superfamily (branch 2)
MILSSSVLKSTFLAVIHIKGVFIETRAQQAGKVYYERYSDLVGVNNLPFVRASSSERVVRSATNWTAGMLYVASMCHLNLTAALCRIFNC